MGLGVERPILVGLDDASECVRVHVGSLTVVPANFRHESQKTPDRTPESRSTSPTIERLPAMRLFFGWALGGPPSGKDAGSAAARHPAGGSTRRRS